MENALSEAEKKNKIFHFGAISPTQRATRRRRVRKEERKNERLSSSVGRNEADSDTMANFLGRGKDEWDLCTRVTGTLK